MTKGGIDMRTTVRNSLLIMIALALLMPGVHADDGVPAERSDGALGSQEPGWAVPEDTVIGGRFIENLGQWNDGVNFATDTTFGHAVLGTDGVTYDVVSEEGGHRVKIAFSADGPVTPEGRLDLGYDTNYFLGNDPDQWVKGARSYQEVVYRDVWPGTDIRYYYCDGHLKYDLILDGEADPSMVRFQVVGAEGVTTEGDVMDIRLTGGLRLHDRDLVAAYDDGEAVAVSFSLHGDGYGFKVDKEEGRTLVIDPVVVHSSTLIGGTYADTIADIELDGDGNVYALSRTESDDFPVKTGAYDDELGQADAALTKFNHNLSQVIWSTFVGGSSWDSVSGLELDRNNNVYFTGATWSHDYPCTKDALNSQFNLGMNNYQMDPFVTKLNNLGNDLVYSTYVGGSHTEWVGDIKVADGRATVVGQTQSVDFPTESGSYGGSHGDGFLFTLNENGTRIVNTFFWGGFGSEKATTLAYAPNGDIVVGGGTSSMGMFTTPGAFQPVRPCFNSGFLSRINPATKEMVFNTYFGGAYQTSISALVLDGDENVYVAGATYKASFDLKFITTPGAYQEEFHGTWDSFLAKLDPNATGLEFCTLLGGDAKDDVYDLELDADGHMVAVGSVGVGTNFTVTPDGIDDRWAGDSEGFLFVLNDDGTAPVYSTFYGGQQADEVYALEIDDVDNYVLAGASSSMDIPLKPDGYQQRLSGVTDGFVSIVGELSPTSAPFDLKASGGEGYIELDWMFPNDDGGYPVKRFLVFRGTSEDNLRFYMDVGVTNIHTDKSVEWGVTYYYSVYASNGKGISPPSNIASDMSVTVPDQPLNLTGTVQFSSVVIEWEPPQFTGGLPITGFIIYRIAEGDHIELVTPVAGNVRAYEDTNVEDGTNYTYTLTALNEFGESREPVSVNLRTFDVPTPPVDLSHSYGDLFINLTWNVPLDDCGLPITGYTIYRRTGEGDLEVAGEVNGTDPTFVDTLVTVGTLYEYSVTAVNAKGESGPSMGIEAMAMVPPDPPIAVQAVASENFVKVTWTVPPFDGASPITGYRVYLGESMDDAVCLGGPNIEGIDDPLLQFLHDVLYDGIVRTYFVTALNAEGESEPSAITTTILYQVPGAPVDPSVEWGDGSLDVGWTVPSTDGGTPVLGYTLYRKADGEDDFRPIANLAIDEMSYLDLETENGLEYTYRLTAHNLAGESDPSPQVSAVPAGLPDAPLNTLAVGQMGVIDITWDHPSNDGGHPLIGYRLYRMEEGGAMELMAEVGPDAEEYADETVVNGVVYIYSVAASTDVGASDRSQVASAMSYGHPSLPVNCVALWVGGRVQLTWSAPEDDGGSQVVGYRIHRHDREAGNMTEMAPLVTTLLDGDVELGVTYNYTVYAFNEAGNSVGAEVSITTPMPEPVRPETSPNSIWVFQVIAIVLVVVAVLLVIMRGKGGIPRQAVL
jgi:fibronectin type 3 domain-containing protein